MPAKVFLSDIKGTKMLRKFPFQGIGDVNSALIEINNDEYLDYYRCTFAKKHSVYC